MALPYYYNEQIKRYLVQFMSVFSGLQVKTGKREDGTEKMIDVPIRYGNVDRVLGWIRAESTQNLPIKVPLMSMIYNDIQLDDSLRKGIGQQRRTTFLERGRIYPDDVNVVYQYMPVPYRIWLEVSIFSSNTDQQLQILEQILVLFDPTLQIQTNDSVFDWTKITTLKLENIGLENNYPIGGERNLRVVTLNFSMPIYLSLPANLRDNAIKEIRVRLDVVDETDLSNHEMVAALDAKGIPYEEWFSLDNVDINEGIPPKDDCD
jgi:hypothetical protein